MQFVIRDMDIEAKRNLLESLEQQIKGVKKDMVARQEELKKDVKAYKKMFNQS